MAEHVEIPKTFKLEFPFDFGKNENAEQIEEITIERRLRAGDLVDIQTGAGMKIGDMLKLISRVTSWPMSKVKLLDAYDMSQITDVINSFLAGGQTSGENT